MMGPMTEPSANPAPMNSGEPLFTAILSPHRSLSLRGFNILMTIVGLASFVIGMGFLMMGAWPVFGFFGLDAALVYFAFRRNYLDARAFEEISLSRDELQIRRVSAHGREVSYTLNPYWTRLLIDRRAWGIASLALASSGRKVPVGAFLSPDDRASFADALSAALASARTAPATG